MQMQNRRSLRWWGKCGIYGGWRRSGVNFSRQKSRRKLRRAVKAVRRGVTFLLGGYSSTSSWPKLPGTSKHPRGKSGSNSIANPPIDLFAIDRWISCVSTSSLQIFLPASKRNYTRRRSYFFLHLYLYLSTRIPCCYATAQFHYQRHFIAVGISTTHIDRRPAFIARET